MKRMVSVICFMCMYGAEFCRFMCSENVLNLCDRIAGFRVLRI